jgi:probable rRNA maturation factor
MTSGDQPPARRVRVAVSDVHGRAMMPALGRWLAGIAPARARGTVHIALISDARVRTLNRRYRGIDKATDVLSFPAIETPTTTTGPGRRSRPVARSGAPASPGTERLLGDIVIARGVARRQARLAGHAEATELRVLALHGLLHLLGYDHERDDGAMARLERRLRQRGGLREGLIERQ